MLKKLFGGGSPPRKESVYQGTVADARIEAARALRGQGTLPSLFSLLQHATPVDVTDELRVGGRNIRSQALQARMGLVDPAALLRMPGIEGLEHTNGQRCSVFAIFNGDTPIHARVVSQQELDRIDTEIVGSRGGLKRDYRISHEERIRKLLKHVG